MNIIPNFDPDLALRLRTDSNLSEYAHTVTVGNKKRILTKDLSASLTKHEAHRLVLDFPESPYFNVVNHGSFYELIVHAGLIADGASIPWFFQWYTHPTEFEEASWAHDALYASFRLWNTNGSVDNSKKKPFRSLADEILRRHLANQTPYIPVCKQIIIYHAVRLGGWKSLK